MYLEALVLGVLIGWIRKGRIKNFLAYEFKGRYFALLALLVFVTPYALQLMDIKMKYTLLPFAAAVLCVLIVLLNHKMFGMKLLLLGLILNLTIMAMNDFTMPLDLTVLREIGGDHFAEAIESGEILNYRPLIGSVGASAFLGKVFAISRYPFATVFSIGDVISSLGIACVVQSSMIINRKGDMLQFSFRPGGGKR